MKKDSLKIITQIALLTAIEIVLSRFLSISTITIKIGFAFLPTAMIAMLYGPGWAFVSSALADFLGALLFPIAPYFPGFTLTAGLIGYVYALVLHQKPKTYLNIGFAVVFNAVVLSFGLNTIWIMMITGQGYIALLIPRVIKDIILIPIEIIMIKLVATRLCHIADPNFNDNSKQQKNKLATIIPLALIVLGVVGTYVYAINPF